MNGPKLEKPRARKEAARVLGIALQTRLRRLYEAQQGNVENEIAIATADMAQCMYENIEFVIWALKSLGGMNPPPPDELKTISKHHQVPIADEVTASVVEGDEVHVFKKPPPPCGDCGTVHDPKIRCPNHHAGMAPSLPTECTCAPLDAGIIGRDKHMVSCPKFVP